ncbi:TetR family transcriptional regulator [Halohasta litchfieldiae]|uniref:Transcriptional regulator, TetR family n=1 Tax=Halohasta litchfieldiae TaxID=1073996 RepID=A0A1H6QW44_9EURY|nr:TetR/AcrR family transcriptional regulator [Halohasta litchfieldiae]ATW88621.1 TetR family transcriptional regulator [Halohasta litchfieldiae]SEI47829.1 transcriptional regulator, TetR family [Halohasta litchfieldiae]
MDTETTDTIIRATGRSLCEYGYADLTMQRIAAESSVTTAAIHYHFDTKEELLNAFLDDLVDRFEQQVSCESSDPRQQLTTLLDAVFSPPKSSSDEFPVALMELKSQAPYHDTYRDRFHELDDTVRTVVTTAVEEGIESGYFADVDAEEIARFVSTAINGGHVRMVALGEEPAKTRNVVEDYLEGQLDWRPEERA